jgi:hypothetical protein
MHQVQLTDEVFEEAQRRARKAGFASVDEFVADRLATDFSDDPDDFDDRFTPGLLAQLDRISQDMNSGKSVSTDELEQHLADVRAAWLKDHAN